MCTPALGQVNELYDGGRHQPTGTGIFPEIFAMPPPGVSPNPTRLRGGEENGIHQDVLLTRRNLEDQATFRSRPQE